MGGADRMLQIDPLQETRRIERLRAIGILDTQDDGSFRSLVEQALGLLPGTCIAAVSLVDTDRQWFKSIVGLDVRQMPRSQSFCAHTIQTEGTLIVEDATQDERFADNVLVTNAPGIRFYAGVRLTGGIGALCVIGRNPRQATQAEILKLTKLAQYVDIQMMAHGTLFNLTRRF
ncbi:GAF domain-containing protein [Jiella pacifica]|nr:GAF domain-containing protein [Jiella pacifica]